MKQTVLGKIERQVKRWDSTKDRTLLITNLQIAGLVAISYGLFLIASTQQGTPQFYTEFVGIIKYIVLLACLVLISGLPGLLYEHWIRKIMLLHVPILVVGAVGLMLWGVSIVRHGFPGSNFFLSFGFFTSLCTYPTYLFRRFMLPSVTQKLWCVRYIHIVVGFAACIVELGMIGRGLSQMFGRN